MLSNARAPSVRVLVDGVDVAGVIEADVDATNTLSADRFSLRLAAAVAGNAFGQPGARVDVRVILDGIETSLILGTVDSLSLDPLAGLLEVQGRDLTAALIEAAVEDSFANRTSSEIAEVLAQRAGLTPNVSATGALAGRFYQGERDAVGLASLARATSAWDLLITLAALEGFDVWVTGETLNFGPPSDDASVVLDASGCMSLLLERQLNLDRPIAVTVRSWGTRAGSSISGAANGDGVGPVLQQTIVRPNLSVADAQTLARQTLDDLLRHRRTIEARTPGDLTLTARSRVTLTGTGAFDDTYRIASLCRSVDIHRGFTQRVTLQGPE